MGAFFLKTAVSRKQGMRVLLFRLLGGWGQVQRGGHRLGTVQGLSSLTSFFILVNFKEQRGRQSPGVLLEYVPVSLHRGPGEIRLSNHAKHNFQFN